MQSTGSKRKRTEDLKSTLVAELYDLNHNSFNLTEDLNDANDHFVQLFQSIRERQSEIYAKSIGVDEQYQHMLGLLKGDIIVQSGESSSRPTNLAASYDSDTPKFFSDSSVSLDNHSKDFLQKVEEMMKEVDEQTIIWKGKLTQMKKQAEHFVSQRTKLAAQLSEFTKKD